MLKDSDFQNDLDINFLGAVKVVKKLIDKLKEAEGASVVFISTVAASIGLPFHASISPAKAALIEGVVVIARDELVVTVFHKRMRFRK